MVCMFQVIHNEESDEGYFLEVDVQYLEKFTIFTRKNRN